MALVTGGARGLGFACAGRLAADGAAIALLDLDRASVEDAATTLAGSGFAAAGFAGDVTREGDVVAAFARISEELGTPDILINAAGVLRPTRFLEIGVEEWNLVVDVSLKGTFLCSQVCIPAMAEAGWGRIVNFSSTAGKSVSTLGGAHYTAAKAAVLGLTRAIAAEVAGLGICVNSICPGLIETEMVREFCGDAELARYAESFPIARLGQPSEVAALVAFLCSAEAGYITGSAFDINGGDLMI